MDYKDCIVQVYAGIYLFIYFRWFSGPNVPMQWIQNNFAQGDESRYLCNSSLLNCTACIVANCHVLTYYLHMACHVGACGTCPSSTSTMKMGIERVLMEKFGDVLKEVVQVDKQDIGASVLVSSSYSSLYHTTCSISCEYF